MLRRSNEATGGKSGMAMTAIYSFMRRRFSTWETYHGVNLISKVRDVLMDSARAGKTITFTEIEKRVGEKIGAWRKVLDPIYEDCIAKGHPDLTAIVIYKEIGYPPFFSDGGESRSKRFNPNNLRQVERWQKEVSRVFEWCTKDV
jgi:hypothetical protein